MWKNWGNSPTRIVRKKATNQQKKNYILFSNNFLVLWVILESKKGKFYFAGLEKWLSGEKAQQLEATKKGGKRKHFVHIYLGGSNGL